jgi:hypothetical protein
VTGEDINGVHPQHVGSWKSVLHGFKKVSRLVLALSILAESIVVNTHAIPGEERIAGIRPLSARAELDRAFSLVPRFPIQAEISVSLGNGAAHCGFDDRLTLETISDLRRGAFQRRADLYVRITFGPGPPCAAVLACARTSR